MVEIVNLGIGIGIGIGIGAPSIPSTTTKLSCRSHSHSKLTKFDYPVDRKWSLLQQQHKLKGKDRFICLFSYNRREEQARKALEGALGGSKSKFEKWDKEIKRREELGGGGGDTGGSGGGWFGWGRWFGWSNDDNFWQEAKQASLTILGIVLLYLLVAKGDLILAVIINPLLYALRGVRNGFGLVSSKVLKNTTNSNQAVSDGFLKKEDYKRFSAKENVVSKWGSD